MIFARPGASFNALLDGVAPGLVGTLTVAISNGAGDVVDPTTDGIVEVADGVYVATLTAPDEGAPDYAVTWDTGTETRGELLAVTDAPPEAPSSMVPTSSEVAKILRARTVAGGSGGGAPIDDFTAETRPTGDQVDGLIQLAVRDVRGVFVTGNVPTASYEGVRQSALYRAAAMVELSYFPEQADDVLNLHRPLMAVADDLRGQLVSAANMRSLFSEAT
jgi:hypothetical protein